MKLYAKTIAQTLPDWATIVAQSGDLIEIEINDEHPNFQSLLEELSGAENSPESQVENTVTRENSICCS
ncbi:hypothetical protein ACEYW6_35810, partial [Nostoc sp. UIC 10607]